MLNFSRNTYFIVALVASSISLKAGNGNCFGIRGRTTTPHKTSRIIEVSPIRIPEAHKNLFVLTRESISPSGSTHTSITAESSVTVATPLSERLAVITTPLHGGSTMPLKSPQRRIVELKIDEPPHTTPLNFEITIAKIDEDTATTSGLGVPIFLVFGDDAWKKTLTKAAKWFNDLSVRGEWEDYVKHQRSKTNIKKFKHVSDPYVIEWLEARKKITKLSEKLDQIREEITKCITLSLDRQTRDGSFSQRQLEAVIKSVARIHKYYALYYTDYRNLLRQAILLGMGSIGSIDYSTKSPDKTFTESFMIYRMLILEDVQCDICQVMHTHVRPPYTCCGKALIQKHSTHELDTQIILNQINFVIDYLHHKLTLLNLEVEKTQHTMS